MQIVALGDVITVARCLRHDLMPQAITDETDKQRIRSLARDYRAICAARPFANKIQLAFHLGLKVFGLKAADMTGHLRRHSIARQQLMAFAFVMGGGEHGYKPIGRVFHRHHATVIHAVLKYEDAIRELVR